MSHDINRNIIFDSQSSVAKGDKAERLVSLHTESKNVAKKFGGYCHFRYYSHRSDLLIYTLM